MLQKFYGMEYFSAEEGHITSFCWNFFSHSAEKFREVNHSMFQKYSGMENFYAEEGDITILHGKIFFSLAKFFVGGVILCFRKNQAWKKFLQMKAISLISVETFFSHSAEKYRGRN